MKLHQINLLLTICLAGNTYYSVANTAADAHTASDANIVGHAVDAHTGEHLPFATISIKGTTIAALCDATGHFHLKHLAEGTYTLTASLVGYIPQEEPITLVRGKTIEVKFALQPDIIAVGQVVVSAARGESSRTQAATIVGITNTRLFENTQSSTLAEGIRFQPGLRVEMTCTNCGVPQLRINGLEGPYSQLLLDSRPLFSSLAAVYGLEQMPAAMIDRVEVIRGGGSALYGSNAIGGVVNIITKEPLNNSIQISNTSAFAPNGSAATPPAYDLNTMINASFVSDDYKAGAYVFGMIRGRSAYDRDADGFSDYPMLKSETLGFRSYYRTSDYSKLSLEYHHIREYRRGGDSIERPPHETNIAEQLRHGINGGGVQWSFFDRGNSHTHSHKGNIYASYQDIRRESYFGTDKNPDAYGNTTDQTIVAGGQYTFTGYVGGAEHSHHIAPHSGHSSDMIDSASEDKHSHNHSIWEDVSYDIIGGVEYTNNRLHDIMLGYNRDITQRSATIGGYVQNEWKSQLMNVVVGARVDKNNLISRAVLCPRANVRFTPSEHVILRAGYASGYRAPQVYDEDLHVGAVGGSVSLIALADGLKPEYSNSGSISADFYFGLGRVQGNVLVEGFYTHLRDVFVLAENGEDAAGNQLLLRQNALGASVMGINVEAKFALTDRNYLQLGCTLQRSRYDELFGWSQTADAVRDMLRSPRQYGYAVLSVSPVRALSVVGNVVYTGSMQVPHYSGVIAEDRIETTPQFVDIGVKVAYDIRLSSVFTLQVNGGVKNVLDAYQRDLERGMLRDSKYIYGPALPRMFFAGLKVVVN
jgi:outer membrane receptor for ferrienterochelin and colicins